MPAAKQQPVSPFGKSAVALTALLLAVIAAYVYWLSPDQATVQFRSKAYYIVATTFLLFCVSGLWTLRKIKFEKNGIRNALTIAGLVLLTLPWHFSQPHSVKIVNDEALLLSTAYQLNQTREAVAPIRGYDIDGDFFILDDFIDKRPLFYPFILSIAHDITGNRPENAFWLNGLFAALLSVCVYSISRSTKIGWIAALLICSVPLLGRSVTSAGFETLNLLMLAITFIASRRFALHASIPNFLFLSSAALLLAQVRYESAFMLLPVGILVIWVLLKQNRKSNLYIALAFPVATLALPSIWQNSISQSREPLAQAYLGTDTASFSIGYFIENSFEAVSFFLSPNVFAENSFILPTIGIAAFVIYLICAFRNRLWKNDENLPFAIMLGGLFFMCVVILSFFYAKFENPLTQRLSLPFFLFFALCIVGVFSIRTFRNNVQNGLLAISITTWSASSAMGLLGLHIEENYAHAEHEQMRKSFIDRHTEETYVMVDPYSTIWLPYEVSVVSYERLRERLPMFAFHNSMGTFKNVYLFLDYYREGDNGELLLRDSCFTPNGLELEIVEEKDFGNHSIVKIAKVISYPQNTDTVVKSLKTELERTLDPEIYESLWTASLP